jgi:HK97 family phage major capsid protein
MRLVTLLVSLMHALWRLAAPAMPPLPRLIKHNLHPFMRRCYGKVLAGGGRTSRLSFAPLLRYAAAVAIVGLGIFALAHMLALDGAAALAMPSLLVTARELKEERMGLVNENRQLIDKAEGEKRAFTAEEQTEYDRRSAKIEELNRRAERMEDQARLEESGEQRQREPQRPATEPGQQGESRIYRPESRIGGVRRTYALAGTEEQEKRDLVDLGRYLRTGRRSAAQAAEAERRAMQADSDTEGGFITTPQRFVADLIQAVDDLLFIRQFARVDQVPDADSLGRPSLDTDLDDAEWTSELATGSLDEKMRFGKRELKPHPLAKRTKISRTLIRKQALDIVAKVRERLAYKMAVPQEKGFLLGTGHNQPLGLFTASNDGIPTTRDVSAGNTQTAVTFDGLKEAKWTLKGQYQRAARWIAHRDFGKMIDKIKDGEGRYIWQPSVLAGEPDRLLNHPLHLSEFAPNTYTSGLYAAVLGDLSFYQIVEALSFEVQVLMELYAETNQVGYIGRAEIDGMPILSEAFVRVKLA